MSTPSKARLLDHGGYALAGAFGNGAVASKQLPHARRGRRDQRLLQSKAVHSRHLPDTPDWGNPGCLFVAVVRG